MRSGSQTILKNIVGMEKRTILARFVFAILLSIFAWKCSEAVRKFIDPGKGQKISVVDYDKVDFPTIAICPVLRKRPRFFKDYKRYNHTFERLAEAYEKAPPVREVFPVVHYYLQETEVCEINCGPRQHDSVV